MRPNTHSRIARVQNVLGEDVHKVSQGGVLPERTTRKRGLFKCPTAASEFDCSGSANLPDILGDRSEDFIDLEDEVGYGGVGAEDDQVVVNAY